MKLTLHCTCGMTMHATVDDGAAGKIKAAWDKHHTGEGHQPCDAKTARLAREKNERGNEK